MKRIKLRVHKKSAKTPVIPPKTIRKIGRSEKSIVDKIYANQVHKRYLQARERVSDKVYGHLCNLSTLKMKYYVKLRDFLMGHNYDALNYAFMENYFYGVLAISNRSARKTFHLFHTERALKKFEDYQKNQDKEDIVSTCFHSILELFGILNANNIPPENRLAIATIIRAGKGGIFHEDYVSSHPLITRKKRKGEGLITWKVAYTRLATKYPRMKKWQTVL